MDSNDKKRKKHILVVSQYFYPESFRINDMCKEWVERGYEVTVLTGIPNYPQGEFYDGYDKKHNRSEVWNGVKIVRIPLLPRKSGSMNMIKNYLSFVWSGFWWNKRTKLKADLVFIFEVSPMTQALIGVWYAKKHKVPCYLYVQDLWPENVESVTGIHTPIVLGPIGCMVNYIYKRCTRIFGTSPSFVTEIQKRCKEKEKVSYWPQYAEEFYVRHDKEKAFDAVPEIKEDDRFKLIFTGNIGQAQGLEILPKAATVLKEKNLNTLFIILGDGRNKPEFLSQIEEYDVSDMFVIIDRKPAEMIPYYLSCCQAAFVSFMDNELFTKTIPAKLQSYMACGMPIVASASGETQRIIEDAQCGLCSPIGDAHRLAEIIEEMVAYSDDELCSLGMNSGKYCNEYFNKRKLMDEMDVFFEKDEMVK